MVPTVTHHTSLVTFACHIVVQTRAEASVWYHCPATQFKKQFFWIWAEKGQLVFTDLCTISPQPGQAESPGRMERLAREHFARQFWEQSIETMLLYLNPSLWNEDLIEKAARVTAGAKVFANNDGLPKGLIMKLKRLPPEAASLRSGRDFQAWIHAMGHSTPG